MLDERPGGYVSCGAIRGGVAPVATERLVEILTNDTAMRTALLLLVALGFVAADCGAVIVASDDASSAAYDDGWGAENSGFGFEAWTFNNGGNNSVFVQSSTTLSGSASGVDSGSPGRALGLFAGGTAGNDFANAFRKFSDPLAIGSTFSLDIAVNFRNGAKGVNVLSGGSTVFTLSTESDDYIVFNAASNNGSLGDTYSDDTTFNLSFTQDTLSGGTWTVTRSGGVTDLDTGTYSGVLDEFQLFASNTISGPANDFFANNFQISAIPEVSAALALPLVFGGVMSRARRRRERAKA